MYSYTVVRRPAGPAFEVPLLLGLVTLAEGPTMMANLVGVGIEDVTIGMALRMEYEDVTDTITLPVFAGARS